MKQIKKWFDGEYIPYKNDPGSPLVFLSAGHYERHWTSRFAHWAIGFYMREWKWVLGSAAAVVGAFVLKR